MKYHIDKKTENFGITIGDSIILMSFSLAKIELRHDNTISDNTLTALNEIQSRTSRFYYYHDHPDLFQIIQEALDENLISKHNKNVSSFDIGVVGISKEDWKSFFAEGINSLFDKLKKSASG